MIGSGPKLVGFAVAGTQLEERSEAAETPALDVRRIPYQPNHIVIPKGPSETSLGFLALFGAERRALTELLGSSVDQMVELALEDAHRAIDLDLRVPSSNVVAAAIACLGHGLDELQARALVAAHLVGFGQKGKDGTDACGGNYTPEQIMLKARVLKRSGFSIPEISSLIKAGVVGPNAVEAAHYAITTDLYRGRIIEAHPFNMNMNNTQLYWVKLFNDESQRVREGLFKPRFMGDNDGWARQPIEYVAYALNRMLQMDWVPPVAYRRHLEVDFKHFEEGAILHMVPDAHLLKKVPEQDWHTSKPLFLSDARILDVLIQNPDRHAGNYLRGRHWVDGSYAPMLIDHAAGFRPRTTTRLDQSDPFGSGAIKVIRRRTYDALKNLTAEWLKREVGEFISEQEIWQLLGRRDGIVAYFEQRARDHGWDKVVL